MHGASYENKKIVLDYKSKNKNIAIVDIKKSVITQAERSLDNQFPGKSEPLKKKLKDLLRTEYHIFLDKPEAPSDSYAVGATSGGGGAA